MPLRYINPNFHVILIHYPLGIFVLGVFLELFSFLWRRNVVVRTAGKMMIVFGALLTLPAATSGLYALLDVKHHQTITDARYSMLRWHVIYMGAASLLAVFCAVVGIGSSDRWRRRLYFPLLLGVLGAWALMVLGAWHGGETIYQQGTSVAIVGTDDNGKAIVQEPKPAAPPISEVSKDATPEELNAAKYDRVVNYYVGGELQNHLILAGFAFAFAMAALGLSMRRLNSGAADDDDVVIQGVVGTHPHGTTSRGSPRRVTDDISVIRSFNPEASVHGKPAGDVPAGRFWLLTALVVLLTIVAGYWVIKDINFLKVSSLVEFKDKYIITKGWPLTRPQAHFYLGAAFFVLALICGFLAWLAPKRSILLAFFGLLLTLVIAAQVWIGVLMAFDSNKGTLYHFRTADEKAGVNKSSGTESDSTAPSGPAATQPDNALPTPTAPAETSATQPAAETPAVPPTPAPPVVTPAPPVPVLPPTPAPTPAPPTNTPAPQTPAVPPAPAPTPTPPQTPTVPPTPAPADKTPATDVPPPPPPPPAPTQDPAK